MNWKVNTLLPCWALLLILNSDLSHGYATTCYNCTDDACVSDTFTAVTCSGTSDSCYTKYNDEYTPLERGCLSALSADDIILCNNSTYLNCNVCTEDNCNVLSREDHTCLSCTSLEDSNCLQNPDLINATRCPAVSDANVLGGYCFVRSSGAVTERGCLTTSVELANCTADSSNCDNCTITENGESCNDYEFPYNRMKCWTCENDACSSGGDTELYCDSTNDTCITFNSQGVLEKGCTATTKGEMETEICAVNAERCEECTTSSCNLGLPDFPAETLCYTCNSTECVANMWTTSTCPLEDDTCFTVFDFYTPTQRGCLSSQIDEVKNLCNETTQADTTANTTCTTCNGTDNCNILSVTDHTCISCNSLEDENCLQDPENIAAIQCPASTNGDAYCFVRNVGAVTERGCLTSSSKLDECYDDEYCDYCTLDENGQTCNYYEFPFNRMKCWTCNSTDCNTANELLQYCPTSNDTCVEFRGGNTIRKGCSGTLTSIETTYCTTYPAYCFTCTTDGCNLGYHTLPNGTAPELPEGTNIQCRNCSTTDDINCSINPTLTANTTCDTTCATYLSRRSDGKLTTQRSCYANLTTAQKTACNAASDTDDFICRSCSTSDCNTAILPAAANRLSCYKYDRTATNKTIRTELCEYYDSSDVCMIVSISNIITRLACRSSLTTSELANCNKSESCISCSTNNCNNPQTIFSCIECNSISREYCATNPTALTGVSKTCPIGTTSCYTRIVGVSTFRGCTTSLSTATQTACSTNSSSSNCELCSTSNCNKNVYPTNRLSCYQCSATSSDADCYKEQNGTTATSTVCREYSTANECYLIRYDSSVTRKCSANGNTTTCADSVKCESCSTSGCNYQKSGTNSRFQINSLLLWLLAALMSAYQLGGKR